MKETLYRQELQKRTAAIEELLKEYLPAEEGYQKTVIEAMNYSLMAGGKRLRPMLMQETYKMFGGKDDTIEPFMAAIEMIHTYSLVHDDLPAMDNDEYRRGRKTTWSVYGDGMGVLAGDGLLNYAFETAFRAFPACTSGEPVSCSCRRLASITAVFSSFLNIKTPHLIYSGIAAEGLGCISGRSIIRSPGNRYGRAHAQHRYYITLFLLCK